MTQNNTTVTISSFLKSRYKNPVTNQLDGLAVDENGDFIHYNIIIDQTYNEVFKDMRLIPEIDDDFKKQFCKRYYNREIGLETFARFQVALEDVLVNECRNLFKARHYLLNKTLEELNTSIDIKNDTNSKGDNQGLGIVNTTPQDRLDIVFTEKYGVIEYANALNENHGKYVNENKSRTHGWQGSSLGERINELANIDDITYNILNICDKCFLQVF